MRIVIIGGAGNISTAIVHRLLEQGHDVTVFRRGETSQEIPGTRTILGDRKDRETFEATMQRESFDAAIDMISFNAEDAESSIRAFSGVGHFVQTSTADVYGIRLRALPADEAHPLDTGSAYGLGKAAADAVLSQAHRESGFPVTIIRPSTTFGPRVGLFRQVSTGAAWIDRIRKGKPLVVCADGMALHQFLHNSEAALAYAGVLGKPHAIGEIYTLAHPVWITWADYHREAMKALGREVELVGVPLDDLIALDVPRLRLLLDNFAHHLAFSVEKLRADVPEFRPVMGLADAMAQVVEALDRAGRIPDSGEERWEDNLIAAQRSVRSYRPSP